MKILDLARLSRGRAVSVMMRGRPSHLFGLALLLGAMLAAAFFAACGDGPTEPPPDPSRATTITVSPATADLAALGATVQLSAEVRDQNGQAMAGAAVTWASSAADVATVDASGLATAVANGSATITATSGSAAGSAAVTVTQSADAVAVQPAEASFAALGDTLRLSAEAFDANGSAVAGAEFSWESSDEAVATVDASGLVTAVANGSATITATSGSAAGSAAVTVAQEVSAVAVTPDAATVVEGDTLRLAATATDANGHEAAGIELVWASGDAAVAVVDSTGLVTGIGAGQVEVTATAAGMIGRAQLTVVLRVPTAVAVTPGTVVLTALGQTERLTAEVRDQIGRVMEDQSIVWASTDSMVATVSASGLVMAVANGTAKITATAGDASGSATVTVAQRVIGFPRGEVVARDEQSLTIQLSTSPETRVELYRSASLTGDYQLVDGNIPALDRVTFYVDDGLQPNTIYYYKAKHCRNPVCSGFSAAWGGVTEAVGTVEVPPTPTRVQGERVRIPRATDDARLWWVPAPRATYYEVYEGNRLDAEVSSPATGYYDGTPDTFFGIFLSTSYRVKACNKAGCSAYSAEVWVS